MNASETYRAIKSNMQKTIAGKDDVLDLVIISLFCGGHVLIEDVPGTGKTMIARALAASIDGVCRRIQFTPDLLPSDITGINYFNMKRSEFEFLRGPIFSHILLADEINRATPKTQAGLLECMYFDTYEFREVICDRVALEAHHLSVPVASPSHSLRSQ